LPNFLLRGILRSRRWWTRWRLQRTQRLQARAEQRLTLLLRRTDLQHLRLKELAKRSHLLTNSLQEQMESQEFRAMQELERLANPLLLIPPLQPEQTVEMQPSQMLTFLPEPVSDQQSGLSTPPT
jgi:hypothetical protein